MSRSGYYDYDGDYDNIYMINWRGAVTSAIRGKRGQAFLREMLSVLDAMPDKRLIKGELENNGEVCALGAVGRVRGLNMGDVDPHDRDRVSALFGIAPAMASEIMFYNDDAFYRATPEERFLRMHEWVVSQIKENP